MFDTEQRGQRRNTALGPEGNVPRFEKEHSGSTGTTVPASYLAFQLPHILSCRLGAREECFYPADPS